MPLNVISLGAGVQSTTMTLMAAAGELEPMPDCAVFSDTGWEPRRVYDHLAWLRSLALPFPIRIVRNGNIRNALTSDKPGRYAVVPFYLKTEADRGIGRRQCTHEYKLKPLRWAYRELLGVDRKKRLQPASVVSWIGISTDEAMRMKPCNVAWNVNRWPLIEKRMNRNDCMRWLERNNFPIPPKSSCIGCPFHNNRHWREMRDNAPNEWADAVAIDRLIRTGGTQAKTHSRSEQYMHPSLKPLDQVDLSTAEDRGQLDLFNNECEGLCGV
jgi:hypothetical protein